MPDPWGNAVKILVSIGADHASNIVMRRSHMGTLIFAQNALIMRCSRKQNTVESASFGSEFVVHWTSKDLIVALHCKLCMFGVLIEGEVDVFCDNGGVVKNASVPDLALAWKHNAINCRAVWEAVAVKIVRVGKEDGLTNLAGLLTKPLTLGWRWELCHCIMCQKSWTEDSELRVTSPSNITQVKVIFPWGFPLARLSVSK